MPSIAHEALVALFQNRPALAAELLSGVLGVDVPAYRHARLESGDLSDLCPTEFRADAVVVLTRSEEPLFAVVVEAQLGKDAGKRWSWPVYLSTLRSRLRCPVVLLVVCAEAATAAWCAAPIDLGHPGWVLTPLVVSPERVPVVTDAKEAAEDLELAVLSAMAHGDTHPERDKIFRALLAGLRDADDARTTLYHDIVLAALPEAARRHLEVLMTTGTYEYKSEFVRRNVAQGRAEGRAAEAAESVLRVLDARGIAVSDEVRARVVSCTDHDQLIEWLRRAVQVEAADELFG